MKKNKIAIIGLGYVGLPLAIEFGKRDKIVAFDVDKKRISELKKNYDRTKEFSSTDLKTAKKIFFTSNKNELEKCNVYILAIPTPIDKNKKPDLSQLKNATKTVAKYIKNQDLVIFESTVYPGVTEEICVPIIRNISRLNYINHDTKKNTLGFYCGYSPERINPGDKKHTIRKIVKVVAGSNKYATKKINIIYKKIVKAGTFVAKDIKTAEAAKVIENTQRDLNIALINEISFILKRMQLDFYDVMNAAKTKWNFIPFKPGLVGGHCIGVDPYYLTFKSKQLGYKPQIILSGRKLNDGMGGYIVKLLKNEFKRKKKKIKGSKILIMGVAFKENCSDFRNSKVIDIYNKLKVLKSNVELYDPHVNEKDFFKYSKLRLAKVLKKNFYDSVIIAVAHKKFVNLGIKKIRNILKKNSVIFDVKSIFKSYETELRL